MYAVTSINCTVYCAYMQSAQHKTNLFANKQACRLCKLAHNH